MNTSYYGSNHITRTWVWRADRLESILDDILFRRVDNESLVQLQGEAKRLIKYFRGLVLEEDFINNDYYPTDYVDGNADYLHRRQLDDNDVITPEVRLRSERRWHDGIRRQHGNAMGNSSW